MGIMVGEQGIRIGHLDVRVIDADGRRDEDEVNLLAFQRRDVAESMPGISGASMIGCHVVGVKEFTI